MTDSNSTSEVSGDSFDDDESENGFATSSECSDSTDDDAAGAKAEQDTLELAKIANETIKLPRGLCENVAIFREFFSMDTWQLLSENFKTYLLCKHFPAFPDSAEDRSEKDKTVRMLFNNLIERFGQSPLLELQRNLEEGNYRPDVLQLRQNIAKSQKRERRFQSCERISQMARQLFISRERLLRSTYKGKPADSVFKINKAPKRHHSLMQLDSSTSAMRANKRFSTEMKCIALQCNVEDFTTDEDNELDAESIEEAHKDSRLCNSTDEPGATVRTNPTSEKCIYSTQFKRQNGIADEDAARSQFESKQKRLSNSTFKQYLLEHKRRKMIEPNLPDFETLDIRLRDVYARAQVGGNFKCVFASNKTPGRKPKSKLKSIISSALPTLSSSCNSNNNKIDKVSDKEKGWVVSGLAPNEMPMNRFENKFSPTGLTEAAAVASAKAKMCEEIEETQFDGLGGITQRKEHDLKQMMEMQVIKSSDKAGDKRVSAFVISDELPQKENKLLNQTKNVWQDEGIALNRNDMNGETAGGQIKSVNKMSEVKSPPDLQSSAAANAISLGNSLNDMKGITMTMTSDQPSDHAPSEGALIEQTMPPNVSGGGAELIQETHACFFSLLRDFFCATPNHRMKFDQLRQKVSVWIQNPITALNDWYTQADNWPALLVSAVQFLAGDLAEQPEEYVPYIEYKSQQGIYQWIGAGRDSDSRLMELSKYWLSRRSKLSEKTPPTSKPMDQRFEADLTALAVATTGAATATTRRLSTDFEDGNASERGISPPPAPRCPTSWTVTAATAAEVAEFQRQERERFENPHRAYTYRMHGYESVVGPVKGIYSQILALTKARGHSMMIGDRPNFVTILTLVRDATARLPNGEGTRADISELLKCSQYINRDAAENVLQTIVSGALDRMHTEHDPCVRYDPKRKIWIYLHRNRSEEEFEQMHQQYQGLGKHKKPTNRKAKPKNAKDALDNADSFISAPIIARTTTAGAAGQVASSSGNVVYSLPALVPANPIIVNTAALNQNIKTQQQQQQPQLTNKFPPVPPLKYNIQPNQQKSLLKTTQQNTPNRSVDSRAAETSSTASLQADFGSVRYFKNVQNISMDTAATLVGSGTQSAAAEPNKTLNNSSKSLTRLSNIVGSNNTTTPIIVATPSGLKTVHVSNATSVSAASTSSSSPSTSLQFIKNDARQTLNASSLSATVGGKKVALNKPIIINQITQQTTQKNNKTPQAMFKPLSQQQQQQLQQQQLQQHQSFHHASSGLKNNDRHKTFAENDTQTATKESKSIQTVFAEKARFVNQEIQANSTKNIVRILSANSNKEGKSVITIPVSGAKQQHAQATTTAGHHILATAVRPQLLQKQMGGGISLMAATASNNNNNNPSSSSVPTNTIVRMSSQAFASFQQKQSQQQQQQQQQHILVKPLASHQQQHQQQRVVMAKSANNVVHASIVSPNKNIILQQMPAGSLISPTKANSAGQHCVPTMASKTSPQLTHSGHKIQAINASNVATQHQKVILQNIKQQQQPVQFKTVQVLSNATSIQQQQQHQQHQVQHSLVSVGGGGGGGGGQQVLRAVAVNSIAPLLKTNVPSTQTKTMIASQAQNVSCFLKAAAAATNQQMSQTSKDSMKTSSASEVTTATGQVISLESLLAKQGGTLRITNATPATSAKAAAAHGGSNIIQLIPTSNVQQEHSTQYTAMIPTHSRNIITLGNAQLHSSAQASTVFTAPLAISVGQAKDASSAATTTKYISSAAKLVSTAGGHSQSHSHSNITTAHMINTNLFEKSPSATTPASSSTISTPGSIKIISTAGIPSSSFNIANIQGKQVILASKQAPSGNTAPFTATLLNRSQKPQNPAILLGGQTAAAPCRLQGNNNVKMLSKGGGTLTSKMNAPPLQTVLVGNQIIRVDQLPASVRQQIQQTSRTAVSANTLPLTTIASTNTGTIVVNNNETIMHPPTELGQGHAAAAASKTYILGSSGQKIRLQTSPNTAQQSVQAVSSSVINKNIIVANAQKTTAGKPPTSRVVLAVQGSGQIVFSSPNYQSGSVNLKSLQNVKVVSVSQANSMPSHDIQQHARIPKTAQQNFIQQKQSMLKSGNGSNGIEKS